MHRPDEIEALVRQECRRERRHLLAAALCAAAAGGGSVLLLGLSGWFIAAAAFAPAEAASFNTLLPSATIRLLAILRTGGRYGERFWGHDAVLRAFSRIRPFLFERLAAGSPRQVLLFREGDVVSRLVDDLDEIEHQTVIRFTASWTWAATMLAGFGLLAIFGGAAVAASVGLIVAALHLLARCLDRSACRVEDSLAEARAGLRDVLTLLCGARAELRAYALQDWMLPRIEEQSRRQIAAQRRIAVMGSWLTMARVAASGVAGMLALGLVSISPRPGQAASWHIERAVLCALAATMMVEGAAERLRGVQRRQAAREGVERLNRIVSRDAATPAVQTGAQPTGPLVLDWQDGTSPVMPGGIVALLGPSGCGKTTLLHQMIGLGEAPPGLMAVGGCDLSTLSPMFMRSCFALAPQDASLLIGTVRENLSLMRPDATEDEMWAALRDVALEDQIRRMDRGLDAWLGEATALSGGEQRRLSLARTLLSDAPWLLLDEPTESLDSATEAVILRNVRARLHRRKQGALIVTHRTAPLAICDDIHRMNGCQSSHLDKEFLTRR